MTEPAKDFWARADRDLLDRWPKDEAGAPEPAAKLDIERITELEAALNMPLVLHGGSGIENGYILRGIRAGIAKINVGTELRQPYERAMREKNDVEYARECVYTRCRELIRDFLRTAGDAEVLAK